MSVLTKNLTTTTIVVGEETSSSSSSSSQQQQRQQSPHHPCCSHLRRKRRRRTIFGCGVALIAVLVVLGMGYDIYVPTKQVQLLRTKTTTKTKTRSSNHSQVVEEEDEEEDPIRNQYAQFPKTNVGLLSQYPPTHSHYATLRKEIDTMNRNERCTRYGYQYYNNATTTSNGKRRRKRRRIFYGALISYESWELLEMVSVESYGLYTAMIVVESNRTQSFQPRNFIRLQQGHVIKDLFGITNQSNVRVVPYVNEDSRLRGLAREAAG